MDTPIPDGPYYMTTTVKDSDGGFIAVGCESTHFNFERIKQHAATLDRPVWMHKDFAEAVTFHGAVIDWSGTDVQR